jgi:hypothetical protein
VSRYGVLYPNMQICVWVCSLHSVQLRRFEVRYAV